MKNRVEYVTWIIRQKLWAWVTITTIFTLMYYVCLMMSLIIRFNNVPNYINVYDWFFSVQTILKSTPSMMDSLMIINEEWLLEVGFMNYDFGMGISEWSLFIAPVKLIGVMGLGALIATNYLLLSRENRACTVLTARSACVATSIGSACVALASITMSWVVCCSTPTWVVGLAIMGLGVSTSLWLEPLGVWVNLMGYSVLLCACFFAAGRPNKDS